MPASLPPSQATVLGRFPMVARDSLSECYFASKGTAVVLAGGGGGTGRTRRSASGSSDIQLHLQSMFNLLRPEETLKMAVKLESVHAQRTRYLVVVSQAGTTGAEEACLLGIDCNLHTTVGLVLRVLAETAITLDGDGGFSVSVCGRQHIFKPVSVQAMWSALQTLHRMSCRAREQNFFLGGTSHDWVNYYEQRIESDRSCLNEWHAMDCIESRRPPSPDSLRTKPREREETERVIRSTLKEIMMSVDLDEVTSKVIRGRLEEYLDMDLGEYKPFIDGEIITIMGQMDSPTEIFDHVYLGSEWNASNLEELQKNGVRHILNVTREIDNFFPGTFNYLNIRVYDDEKTDLLKHWDNTFKYISRAKDEGSKVLVHCKMGVSRSASVVIAYAMKAFDWNFDKAMKHVKGKRTCIKPNSSFVSQLETYQGILDAMKNKEKLQRSKSETNLKSPGLVSKTGSRIMEPTPLIQALSGRYRGRPRSWSPDTRLASQLLPPTSVSLENLAQESRNVLMPCANGSYSVSQNRIMRIKGDGIPNVKHIVNELESQATNEKKNPKVRSNLKLNLNNHNQDFIRFSIGDSSCNGSDSKNSDKSSDISESNFRFETLYHGDSIQNILQSKQIMGKTETWDPGENGFDSNKLCYDDEHSDNKDVNEIIKCDSGVLDLRAKPRQSIDLFSKQVDRVFDKEEQQHGSEIMDQNGSPLSRQSSISSCDSAVVIEKLSRHSSWGSYDTKPSRNSSWGSYDEPWHLGTVKRTKQKLEEGCSTKRICPDADVITCNGVNEAVNNILVHKLVAPTCDLDIINENYEQICNKSLKYNKNANGNSDSVTGNKQKNDKMSAILKELDLNSADDLYCIQKRGSLYSPLSASAPVASCINMLDRHSFNSSSNSVGNLTAIKPIDAINSSVFQMPKHKNNWLKMDNTIAISKNTSGIVMNLKNKFEANSNAKTDLKNASNVDIGTQNSCTNSNNNNKGRSLPSSPVSVHIDKQSQMEHESNVNNVGQTTSLEDLSVKVLVGKYDKTKSQQYNNKISLSEPPVPLRKSSLNRDIDNKAQKQQSIPFSRNSVCGTIKNSSAALRPPVAPTVVAMSANTYPNSISVLNKPQKKQLQHGKTHPLTRLSNNKCHTANRCNNTVYNTM
ncbi:protein phosphatase Slingshot isoform X2 [Arctopsyche grandis]|uniref:protein phosphatase Slingshot isoform X2 n=1 Tax=Arctopsyche grandis TaxID=121162 RepID=UPI00406D711E